MSLFEKVPELSVAFDGEAFVKNLSQDITYVLAFMFHAAGAKIVFDTIPDYSDELMARVLIYSRQRVHLFDMFPNGMPPGVDRAFSAVYFCEDFNRTWSGICHVSFETLRGV